MLNSRFSFAVVVLLVVSALESVSGRVKTEHFETVDTLELEFGNDADLFGEISTSETSTNSGAAVQFSENGEPPAISLPIEETFDSSVLDDLSPASLPAEPVIEGSSTELTSQDVDYAVEPAPETIPFLPAPSTERVIEIVAEAPSPSESFEPLEEKESVAPATAPAVPDETPFLTSPTPYLRPVQPLPPCPADLGEYSNMTSDELLEAADRAVRSQDYMTVRICVCAGLDVNRTLPGTKSTLLHISAAKHSPNCTWILASSGAYIEARDNGGRTPLFAAVHYNAIEVVKALLAKNADTETQSGFGYTPLILASSRGYTEFVQILLDEGAAVDARSKSLERTALMLASRDGEEDTVELLIAAGADVNAVDKNGTSSLALAASGNYTEIEKMLIGSGADVDLADSDGNTALHVAAAVGAVKSVKILVKGGASTTIENAAGEVPADVVCQKAFCDEKTKSKILEFLSPPTV